MKETPVSVEGKLAMTEAVLEAVTDAAAGTPVSDFMESFYIVRRVQELYAASAVPVRESPQEGWQPIETAPKDGAEYLAFKAQPGVMAIARWYQGEHRSVVEIFCLSTNGTYCGYPLTHWMPLPALPAAGDLVSPESENKT